MAKSWLVRVVTVACLCVPLAAHADEDAEFAAWLAGFKTQAAKEGIPPAVLEDAFAGVTPDDTVVTLDRKQPEGQITLAKYLSNTVTPRRIRLGRALMEEHRAVLEKISAQYHVQPKYLVALWGIESDYGALQGNFSVVQSLATLAYEGRRREFFSKELMAALQVMTRENIAGSDLTGSWAGAMGNCQFMPSTYLSYAVDGDGDGRRDIWNSVPDTLASIANYLHALGWQDDQGWGVAVDVPDGFGESDTDLEHWHRFAAWRTRGFTLKDGANAPGPTTPLYAIYAGKNAEGAYLVTDNFKAILQWNRSRYFATAVGTLADAIEE